MCVVDDHGDAAGAAVVLQASGGGFQRAQRDERFGAVGAQGQGGGVDCQDVVGVVLPDQLGPDLGPVEFEEHAFETLFQDAAGVVRDGLAGICHDLCLGILDHHFAVPVVDVGDCLGGSRKVVEEQFLATQVFSEGSVVVKVVVGKVGEYPFLEF